MTTDRPVPPVRSCQALVHLPSGVLAVPPRCDPESLRQAEALAEAVRTELISLENEDTLDAFMECLRGRRWSS